MEALAVPVPFTSPLFQMTVLSIDMFGLVVRRPPPLPIAELPVKVVLMIAMFALAVSKPPPLPPA